MKNKIFKTFGVTLLVIFVALVVGSFNLHNTDSTDPQILNLIYLASALAVLFPGIMFYRYGTKTVGLQAK